MTNLIDRYLQQVLQHLPESKRADVGKELKGLIEDMVEARVDAGEEIDLATRNALTELGNPAKLATSYADGPRYLIGPTLFPVYLRLLSTWGLAVLGILAAITLGLGIVDGDSASEIVRQVLSTIFEIGTQILLWTTVTFAILEWAPDANAKDFLSLSEWSVDDLPESAPARQISLGDTLFSAGTTLALAVIAIMQYRDGVGAFIRGMNDRDWIDLPIFNPDLSPLVVTTFFLLTGVSLAVTIARYVVGVWTPAVVALTIADSVLWFGFVGLLTSRHPIFNPELVLALDPGNTRWQADGQLNSAVVVVVGIVSLIDCWDAIKGFRKNRLGRSTTFVTAGES